MNNMIEVYLNSDDDFLKVRETLTRIGIASRKTNTLFQSCHILHKRGKYYIVHFKELFALDGKDTNFDAADLSRRNTIANLLDEWNLVELVVPEDSADPVMELSKIKILPYSEKANWTLETKYNLGKRKTKES